MRMVALVALISACGSDPASSDGGVDGSVDAAAAIVVETVATTMVSSGTNTQLTLVAPRTVRVGDRIVVAVQAGSMQGATSCADPRGNIYQLDAQVGGWTSSGVTTTSAAVVTTELQAGDAITRPIRPSAAMRPASRSAKRA